MTWSNETSIVSVLSSLSQPLRPVKITKDLTVKMVSGRDAYLEKSFADNDLVK